MAYESTPASREQNWKRLVDIIRIGHDSLEREHERLKQAIIGIKEFQAIPSDPKTKKVYQYQLENQHQYNIHEVVIESALASFEPVINDSKDKLFKLEMNIPKQTPVEMPKPQTPVPEQTKKPDTRSLMEKIKGTPEKTRIITPDDPYQDGLDFLRRTRNKIDRIERFQEYQSYGIDLALNASFSMMMRYLKIHRTRFNFEMAPAIIRVHKQFIEIIKEREKQGAIQVGRKIDEEIFQTRNDFMLQQQNQPK